MESANLTNKDLNISIEKLEIQCNIHHVDGIPYYLKHNDQEMYIFSTVYSILPVSISLS